MTYFLYKEANPVSLYIMSEIKLVYSSPEPAIERITMRPIVLNLDFETAQNLNPRLAISGRQLPDQIMWLLDLFQDEFIPSFYQTFVKTSDFSRRANTQLGNQKEMVKVALPEDYYEKAHEIASCSRLFAREFLTLLIQLWINNNLGEWFKSQIGKNNRGILDAKTRELKGKIFALLDEEAIDAEE